MGANKRVSFSFKDLVGDSSQSRSATARAASQDSAHQTKFLQIQMEKQTGPPFLLADLGQWAGIVQDLNGRHGKVTRSNQMHLGVGRHHLLSTLNRKGAVFSKPNTCGKNQNDAYLHILAQISPTNIPVEAHSPVTFGVHSLILGLRQL